jgi:hypothetical protein
VLPWHWGGDPWFTYDEAVAYRDAASDLHRARKWHADQAAALRDEGR